MHEVKVGQLWQYGKNEKVLYEVLKVVEPFCKLVRVEPKPMRPKPFMVKTMSLNKFYKLVEA